jgi:hypothetical protein
MHDNARKVESQQDTNLSGFSDSMLRDCQLIIFRKKIAVAIWSIMTLFISNFFGVLQCGVVHVQDYEHSDDK